MVRPEVLAQRQQANLSDVPGMFNTSLIDVKQQPPKQEEAGEDTVFEDNRDTESALGKYWLIVLFFAILSSHHGVQSKP